MGSQRGRHDWAPFTHSITQCLMNATDSLKLVELSDLCSGMLTSFLRKMLVIWLKEINKKNELRELFFDVLLFPDWRRQWQPTPELLPGKSHGWRSLVGCSPWGRWGWDTTERLHFHSLEKEMATHSSVLAWRIPRTAEPGGLPSVGSHRVGNDWSDLAARASQVAQMVKNPTAMQATGVRSLGQKDPLKKEMATHSSILVWEIPWTEEPWGCKRVRYDLVTKQQDSFLP